MSKYVSKSRSASFGWKSWQQNAVISSFAKDADGAALAAIQALYRMSQALEARFG